MQRQIRNKVSISISVPIPILTEVDDVVFVTGQSRSEFIFEAVKEKLQKVKSQQV